MSDPAPPASEGVRPEAGSAESFGRYLSQQRELRGLTLQNVADSTKLSVTTLKALETDDHSRLPERVFVVGFVKAYAKAVGLNPEETSLRLEEALGRVPVSIPAERRTRDGSRVGWVVGGVAVVAAVVGAALHFHLFR